MSTCRSCDAPVAWVAVKRKDGTVSRMPLDAHAETGEPLEVEAGNVVPIGHHTDRRPGGGRSVMVRIVGAGQGRWRSHFSTCPNAKSHRR